MNIKTISTFLLLVSLYSCNFSRSVNKDLNTGLLTKGNGLSCDRVYLSSGDEVLKRSEFIYGEVVHIYFEDMDGFNRSGDRAFPGMELTISDTGGEVIFEMEDMYAENTEGFDFTPLELSTWVTFANPIHSGESYHLFVKIWDKKGEGTFTAEMDLEVVPNDNIKIESNQVIYKEIYLFCGDRQKTLTDNIAGFNETLYLLFEGLDGFIKENGMVFPGLSISLTEADGNVIINEQDLMGDGGMDYAQFHSQLTPNFIFNNTEITNPVTCEITIWDKKSEARISASTEIQIE